MTTPDRAWIDPRLDDLSEKVDDGFAKADKKMDDGFARVDTDIRDLRGEMKAGFERADDKMEARFDRLDKKFDKLMWWLLGAATSITLALLGLSAP